jgi:atypical dual specificity phosphatase
MSYWPNFDSIQKFASDTFTYITNSATELAPGKGELVSMGVEKAKNIKDSVLFHVSLGYNIVNHSAESQRWWDRITDNIVLGALPFHDKDHQNRLMEHEHIKGVVIMCRDFEFNPLLGRPVTKQDWESKNVSVYHSPTQDFEAPSVAELKNCVDFIIKKIEEDPTSSVYVHCKAGRGRSVAVVVCFLITQHGITTEQAINTILSKRSHIHMGKSQINACKQYEEFYLSTTNPHTPESISNSYNRLKSDSFEIVCPNSPDIMPVEWTIDPSLDFEGMPFYPMEADGIRLQPNHNENSNSQPSISAPLLVNITENNHMGCPVSQEMEPSISSPINNTDNNHMGFTISQEMEPSISSSTNVTDSNHVGFTVNQDTHQSDASPWIGPSTNTNF